MQLSGLAVLLAASAAAAQLAVAVGEPAAPEGAPAVAAPQPQLLAADDECAAADGDSPGGRATCALNALQHRAARKAGAEVPLPAPEAGPTHDEGAGHEALLLAARARQHQRGTDTSIAFPLRTSGRFIVDKNGKRVKLACVNWTGGAQMDGVVAGLQKRTAKDIARTWKEMGFNCVRLPWSVWMVETDPPVGNQALIAANPDLKGKTTLEVFDAVIEACAANNVMVVIDNHSSDGIWCCSNNDNNGMWWNYRWSEAAWMDAHRKLARRYKDQPWVVGSELRNELRPSIVGAPSWGDGTRFDWHAAATRAGNAVLQENPNLLVVVGGLQYNEDLTGVHSHPVRLSVPDRLVYAAHCYDGHLIPNPTRYEGLKEALGKKWGYIITPNQPYTAPVFISEFGTFADGHSMKRPWWPDFLRYLTEGDFDWAVWRGDGTESHSRRTLFSPTDFGVLSPDWAHPANHGDLVDNLQTIQTPRLGPGVEDTGCKNRCQDTWNPGWSSGRAGTEACTACLRNRNCRKEQTMEQWCKGSFAQASCSQTCCLVGMMDAATCPSLWNYMSAHWR